MVDVSKVLCEKGEGGVLPHSAAFVLTSVYNIL